MAERESAELVTAVLRCGRCGGEFFYTNHDGTRLCANGHRNTVPTGAR